MGLGADAGMTNIFLTFVAVGDDKWRWYMSKKQMVRKQELSLNRASSREWCQREKGAYAGSYEVDRTADGAGSHRTCESVGAILVATAILCCMLLCCI